MVFSRGRKLEDQLTFATRVTQVLSPAVGAVPLELHRCEHRYWLNTGFSQRRRFDVNETMEGDVERGWMHLSIRPFDLEPRII